MLNAGSALVKLFFAVFSPQTLSQCDISVALGQPCRTLPLTA